VFVAKEFLQQKLPFLKLTQLASHINYNDFFKAKTLAGLLLYISLYDSNKEIGLSKIRLEKRFINNKFI